MLSRLILPPSSCAPFAARATTLSCRLPNAGRLLSSSAPLTPVTQAPALRSAGGDRADVPAGMRTGLDAFRDAVPREQRERERVGRKWTVKELRRKGPEDLQKLWLVLYKEKNMLLTEKQLARRRGLDLPQPERWHKVKKSMGAIRRVFGERKRERIAARAADTASSNSDDDELDQEENEARNK